MSLLLASQACTGTIGAVEAAPDAGRPADASSLNDSLFDGPNAETGHDGSCESSGNGSCESSDIDSSDDSMSAVDGDSHDSDADLERDGGGDVDSEEAGPSFVTRDGGGSGDAGSSDAPLDPDGATDAGACQPIDCGTHAWACWSMPNSPKSGLPNPARFTDLHDGTVRDDVTCLVWERDVTRSSPAFGWDAARQHCESLSLAGGGWRLPTRIEALSIADTSRLAPAIDVAVFVSATPQYHWTSSPAVETGAQAASWIVDLYSSAFAMSSRPSNHLARCVRGNGSSVSTAPPPNHYTMQEEGDVRDNYTGLVWQRDGSHAISSTAMGWADAARYCEAVDGGIGWRLPTIKELATLVDDAVQSSPTIDRDVFASTSTSAPYWASTVWAEDSSRGASGRHWSLSFQDGTTGWSSTLAYAKCVR